MEDVLVFFTIGLPGPIVVLLGWLAGRAHFQKVHDLLVGIGGMYLLFTFMAWLLAGHSYLQLIGWFN